MGKFFPYILVLFIGFVGGIYLSAMSGVDEAMAKRIEHAADQND